MAVELGEAYVRIVPVAKGISGKIQSAIGSGDKVGANYGKGFSSALTAQLKKLAIGATIGKVIKDTISEGASLEQSLGGIRTIFKKHSEDVIRNSELAYRTAGMSQNAYLEMTTKTAGAMLRATGNDYKRSAELSDLAVKDMADNFNKLSTPMETLQQAYMGFSRGQFQMLDSLALGYSGTKQGMQELLDHAEELTGKKFDISSYADIVEAIHAVQEELNITGATAEEAQKTISGSLGMLKASWKDALGQLVVGENVEEAFKGLVTSLGYVAVNLGKAFVNIGKNLPTAFKAMFSTLGTALKGVNFSEVETIANNIVNSLVKGLQTGLPNLLTNFSLMMSKAIDSFQTSFPKFMEAGTKLIVNLAQGFISSVPSLLTALGNIIIQIGTIIVSAVPTILQSGATLFKGLITSLKETMPNLISSLLGVIDRLVKFVIANAPKMAQSAFNFFKEIGLALLNAMPSIISGLVQLVAGLVKILISNAPSFFSSALSMIGQLLKGIVSMIPSVLGALGNLALQGIQALAQVDWISAGLNLVSSIASGIASAVQSVITGIGSIVSAIIDTLSNIDWLGVGKSIIDAIGSGIANGVKSIPSTLGSFGSGIVDFFTGGGWKQGGEQSAKQINTGLESQSPLLMNAGKKLGYSSVSGFDTYMTPSRNSGIKLGTNAVNGLATKYSSATSTGKSLANYGVTGFGSLASSFNSTGGKLGNSGVTGIRGFFGGASSAGSGLGSSANSGLASMIGALRGTGGNAGSGAVDGVRAGSGGAFGVGVYMMAGVESGILDRRSGVINAAVNTALQAYRQAKHALDIKSPSRLFRDGIGKFISLGMAVGIEDYAQAPVNATQNMIDEVIGTAETGMKQVADMTAQDFNAQTSVDVNSNTALGTVIELLSELVGKDMSIYMNGEKVGEQLTPIINRKLGEIY